MSGSLALAALLVAAAAALHHAIGRAAARAPRWLARRRGEAVGPGVRLGRAFALGALALRAGLWLGVAAWSSGRFEPLMRARGWSLMLLLKALRAPLFALNERAYSALDLIALPALLLALWLGVGVLVRTIRSQVTKRRFAAPQNRSSK